MNNYFKMKNRWRIKRSKPFGHWTLECYHVIKDKWLTVDHFMAYDYDEALEHARERIWWYEHPDEVIEIKDIKI